MENKYEITIKFANAAETIVNYRVKDLPTVKHHRNFVIIESGSERYGYAADSIRSFSIREITN